MPTACILAGVIVTLQFDEASSFLFPDSNLPDKAGANSSQKRQTENHTTDNVKLVCLYSHLRF